MAELLFAPFYLIAYLVVIVVVLWFWYMVFKIAWKILKKPAFHVIRQVQEEWDTFNKEEPHGPSSHSSTGPG